MNQANNSTLKSFIKSIIIIVAPIIILVAIFIGGFAVSNRVTEIRRAGQAADAIYDFGYLLTELEQNSPTLQLLQLRDGIDLIAIGSQVQEVLETEYTGDYIMRLYRLLGQSFVGPLGPTNHTGSLNPA